MTTQILIHPLNLVREAFFKGGLAYTCVFERKFKEVFAAGGRYDSLIKDQVPKILNRTEKRHAVGFFLNWESLAYAVPKSSGKAFLKRAAEEESQGLFSTKRVGFPVPRRPTHACQPLGLFASPLTDTMSVANSAAPVRRARRQSRPLRPALHGHRDPTDPLGARYQRRTGVRRPLSGRPAVEAPRRRPQLDRDHQAGQHAQGQVAGA